MKCEYLILCERVDVDEHNRQSLIRCMNRLRLPHGDDSAEMPALALTAKIVGEPGATIKPEAKFIGPDGRTLTTMASDGQETNPVDGLCFVTWHMQGWRFDPGRYEFVLSVDGEELTRTSLDVVARPPH